MLDGFLDFSSDFWILFGFLRQVYEISLMSDPSIGPNSFQCACEWTWTAYKMLIYNYASMPLYDGVLM